jgi:hypothetical protein
MSIFLVDFLAFLDGEDENKFRFRISTDFQVERVLSYY